MAQRAFAEDAVQEGQNRPARPVDLAHLAKQCLGDEFLELEVLRMFDTTIANYWSRLKQASDVDDLTLLLHTIKGASLGVGAVEVAQLAKALEEELHGGRPLAPERIEDLGMAVEEVRDFIARRVAGAGE
ncbi:MAG: hypothetical protein ABS75_18385 [Pelagibacterium sp. SCN 63-23]|nr:MAG: hypothetical protein ABS75_18385 [Pelagibacterium sp. SCN 63-23]